jgi:two-component system sensor histidine kinase ComD
MIIILGISILLSRSAGLQNFLIKYYAPNKKIIFVITICLIFLITIITDILYYQRGLLEKERQTLLIIVVAYFIVNFSLAFSLVLARNEKQRIKIVLRYGEHLESINSQLRSMAHDYNGHLQMIQTINEQGDVSALSAYLDDLLSKKVRASDMSYIKDNTYISAFLHNSSNVAKELSITYVVHISDTLSGYRIASHDLVDVLINLINNAFEAVILLSKDKRIVHIDFHDQAIEVRNIVPQSVIKTGISDFTTNGFSSKGANRGLGIGNIIAIVEKYEAVFANYLDKDYYVSSITFKE